MNPTPEFDIAPLSWIRAETGHALQSAANSLRPGKDVAADVNPLREARTWIHQVTGALEMAGLRGVALVNQETENLLQYLESNEAPAEAGTQLVLSAIDTIELYLDDLLRGKPNQELQLFPLYRQLRETRGITRSAESDLFFPDLDSNARSTVSPNKNFTPEEQVSLYRQSRSQFERGLLAFLRQKDAVAGLTAMREAVQSVETAMSSSAARHFWWGCGAFIDSLITHSIEPNFEVKQLCGRIDQQLKRHIEGSNKVAEKLLRDLLYFVANSRNGSERIAQVKQSFGLNHIIPSTNTQIYTNAGMRPIIDNALRVVNLAKNDWAQLATSNNTESLMRFQMHADELHAVADKFGLPGLQPLISEIHHIAIDYRAIAAERLPFVHMDVATALLLLQVAIEHHHEPDQQMDAQAALLSQRLQLGAWTNETLSAQPPDLSVLEQLSRAEQDHSTLEQVVVEIRHNLNALEEALDNFFRDDLRDPVALHSLEQPLHELRGAFGMLQWNEAEDILAYAIRIIQQLQENTNPPEEHLFVDIADAISSLGLYADAMRFQQTNAEAILQAVLIRLGLRPAPTEQTPVDFPHVDDETAELQNQSNHQSNRWQANCAPNEDASLSDSQQPLSQDAAPVNDPALHQHATEALNLITEDPQAILGSTELTSPDPEIAIPVIEEDDLLDIFTEEAAEVIDTTRDCLNRLQQNPHDVASLTEFRRGFHTLKGSGRMVGLTELGETAWAVEQLLNLWLQENRPIIPELLALLEQAQQHFSDWVEALIGGHDYVADHAALAHACDALREQQPSHPDNTCESAADGDGTATHTLPTIAPDNEIPALFGAKDPASSTEAVDSDGAITDTDATTIDSFSDDIFLDDVMVSASLLGIYRREADGHLQNLRDFLSNQRANPTLPVDHEFVRAAHTLAGTSRLTGFIAVAELAYTLEHWLSPLVPQALPVPAEYIELVSTAIDALSGMLLEIADGHNPAQREDLVEQLNQSKPSFSHTEPNAPASTIIDEPPIFQPVVLDSIPTETPDDTPSTPPAKPDEPALSTSHNEARDDVDTQLLPIFLEEANELMPEIARAMRELQAQPDGPACQSLQRLLHTLKGSARMAGAMHLGQMTHELESAIQQMALTPESIEQFSRQSDQIALAIDALMHPTAAPATSQATATPQTTATPQPESDTQSQTLRVRTEILEELINEAGEISISRAQLENSTSHLRENALELTDNAERLRAQLRELEIQAESQMQSTLSHLRNDDSGFDPLEFDRFTRLQELTRMMAESLNDIQTVQQNLLAGITETDATITQQGRLARSLQQSLMHIRMVPLSSIADRLHRTVRLAAYELGKKTSLQINGEDVEFDRGVLEKIVAPIEHLLRNSVAHGIEAPADRLSASKSEYGDITLDVRQQGNEIILTLHDDGRGLDLAAIRSTAIKNGLMNETDQLSDDALQQLIFHSGFSTAQEVTTLSGRGVGMDVVKTDINQLGGRIDLQSITGQGLTTTISLPLTLAVTQAVLVRAGDRQWAIPSAMIAQVQEYKTNQLQNLLDSRQINFGGQTYPVVWLAELLGYTRQTAQTASDYVPVLLLTSGNQRAAIMVEKISNNQEIVNKKVGAQLASVPGISGATVLGNGEIVLILNPVTLFQHRQLGQIATTNPPLEKHSTIAPYILVVDDSLTVRKITSRLLQREGYTVNTAKDGIDALQIMQRRRPDLILLDIEMPRMDGFELAQVIRSDLQTASLPIIMITSRTADKHREHAEKLGVNAYLGKPYHEDRLLQWVRQLTGDTTQHPDTDTSLTEH